MMSRLKVGIFSLQLDHRSLGIFELYSVIKVPAVWRGLLKGRGVGRLAFAAE